MQVEILALIILKGLSAENIVSRKVVKGDKNIFQPQDRAKEPDKVLLGGFSRDGRIKREEGQHVLHLLFIFCVILGIGLQQSDILGVLVSKKSQSVVGFLFEVAE